MSWLVFALLSTISFSAAGLLDKFFMSHQNVSPKAYLACQILMQQLFTIPVFILAGVKFSYPGSIYATIVGAFNVIPTIYYLKAIQKEEASRVAAIEYLYIIFVLLGAGIFLGEALGMRQCVGGLFLLASIIAISYKRDPASGISAISPAIKYFYIYWILTAAYHLSLKYLLGSADEFSIYAWASLGNLAMVAPMLADAEIRTGVFTQFKRGASSFGAMFSEEVFHFSGTLFSIGACAAGSMASVSIVSALEPFLSLVFIMALSTLRPGLVEEELNFKAVMQKGAAFSLLVLGIYVIS
jgi:uncharacterized membrane protein